MTEQGNTDRLEAVQECARIFKEQSKVCAGCFYSGVCGINEPAPRKSSALEQARLAKTQAIEAIDELLLLTAYTGCKIVCRSALIGAKVDLLDAADKLVAEISRKVERAPQVDEITGDFMSDFEHINTDRDNETLREDLLP